MQALVLVLVVLVACGGGRDVALVARPQAVISIVEPGAEPRKELRYELTTHDRERFEMEIKLGMSAAFTNTVREEGQRSADVPTLRLTGYLQVTSVSPSGEAAISSVVDDVAVLNDSIDPTLRSRTQAETAALKGLRTSWRMDPLGRTSEIAVETPHASRHMSDRLSSFVDSIRPDSVVFPEQEVGVGATWQVVSKITWSKVIWTRTVKYRLTAMTDTSVTVFTEMVTRASSQALSVEPNASTVLRSGTANMTGDLLLRRHAVMGTGRAQGSTEMNFQIVRDHVRTTSTVRSEIVMRTKSVAEPGEHGGEVLRAEPERR
ncbi:MAG: hypothetical protein AB7O24_10115 [Kofleriaceae bacterium]